MLLYGMASVLALRVLDVLEPLLEGLRRLPDQREDLALMGKEVAVDAEDAPRLFSPSLSLSIYIYIYNVYLYRIRLCICTYIVYNIYLDSRSI